jgi:hypothetical protein
MSSLFQIHLAGVVARVGNIRPPRNDCDTWINFNEDIQPPPAVS